MIRSCPRGLLPALVLLTACDSAADPQAAAELPEPVPVEVPAGAGAAQPFVAAGEDGFIVSWTEPAGAGHALRFASLEADGAWTEPRTVAEGEHWFVNWADFPSVVALTGRELAAHWLRRSGPGTYAYDVMVTQSPDGGATWSPPVRLHRDTTQTEHGFVSLFPHDGGVGAVWLDGRRFAGSAEEEPTNQMTVRFTSLQDGTAGPELLIDERACDCCQTAAAVTAEGPVVAYRDRTQDEIRDISVTRLVDGAWTEPRRLHADEWHITGCPVNGPQADAAGRDVVIAWFTMANDTPRVQLTFSADAGATFGQPFRIDDGDPLGRVDVLLLEDGRALAVWLERAGEEAELRARMVGPDGAAGASRVLATTAAQRASGFPRMAQRDGVVLLSWTQPGEPSTVRAARLDLR